jgi:hypothetical protein
MMILLLHFNQPTAFDCELTAADLPLVSMPAQHFPMPS